MLEAIVLLWIVVKLEAPLWIIIFASLTLLASATSTFLSAIESLQKQKRRSKIDKRIDEIEKWLDDNKGEE